MDLATAQVIFENVRGTRFVGIDTLTVESRLKRDEAVQPGKLTKRTTGSVVMVFAQKDPTAFNNQVLRRMEKEGLDPTEFKVGPLSYGEWMEDSPFIVYTKKGDTEPTYYLRTHFVKAGASEYFLDGKPINKNKIVDTSAPKTPSKQARLGITDEVIPRNFKLDSLTAIRIDGAEYIV